MTSGEPGVSRANRSAPNRDERAITCREWVVNERKGLIAQIENAGGPCSFDGAITPKAWPAIMHQALLEVAFRSDVHRASVARVLLALHSFAFNGPPNEKRMCSIKIATLAARCGLSAAMTKRALNRLEELTLIQISRRRDPRTRERRASDYVVERSLLQQMRVLSTAGASRWFSSDIAVLAFVLKKTVLKKGYADFSRLDLDDAGLASRELAVSALLRLIGNGVLVRVGPGRAALRLIVEGGQIDPCPANDFWDKHEHS